MYEQVIAGVGLSLLLVLCLPFPGVQRLVLNVYAWVLRLALLALVGTAGYLWFRPEHLPVEVTHTLNNSPFLRARLPEPGTQNFAISAAALVVAVLLPLLAVLDACRKPASRGQRRLGVLSTEPGATEPILLSPAPQRGPSPGPRRIGRREAAEAMAGAGLRKPCHTASHLEQ